MTEHICLFIFHLVSEGAYPHSVKRTLFVGFIPVTRFGEARKGKSGSAALVHYSECAKERLPCPLAEWRVD